MPGPFGHLAGYENVNGVERLRHDPAMRWIISGKAPRTARLRSQMCRQSLSNETLRIRCL
jgi:hypothetical protein